MNEQKKEQPVESEELELVEMFHSIQGEGPWMGRPAIFIRLAGCNLACPQCDTDYTTNRQFFTIPKIIEAIKTIKNITKNHGKTLVVITGGEPFRQPVGLAKLVNALDLQLFDIQIETNGTLYADDFPWPFVTVVCSPKIGVHSKLRPRVAAFKYLIDSTVPGISNGIPYFVLDNKSPVYPVEHGSTPVYLQPVDVKDAVLNKANQEATLKLCLKHGHTFSPQLHKMVGKE